MAESSSSTSTSSASASTPPSPASSTPSSPSSSSNLTQSSATSADDSVKSNEIDPSLSTEERKKRAIEAKELGNKDFIAQKYQSAKDHYSQAIALDPTVATYFNNRAFCEFRLEQHGLAIEDSTKALELDPKNSKALYRRGQANLSILDSKAALSDFKAALKLEPNNSSIKAFVADTQKLIRRLAFEKAIKSNESPKSWMNAVQHLKENTGPTSLPKDYKGPILKDGDEDQQVHQVIDDPEEASRNLLSNKDAFGKHMGKIDKEFVEEMIQFFKDGGRLPTRYAWQIMLGAQKELMKEESLVDYHLPKGQTIDVVGDTHGQFYDFVHLLNLTGPPSETHAVLFNGDFVDRGSWSLEIVLTLLAYKWLYPKTTLVNRGNHETSDMNKVYGFEGEVKAKLGPGDFSFKLFTELFVALPLATLISTPETPLQGQDLPAMVSKAQKSPILSPDGKKRFFVVHGGLFSKDEVLLKDIKEINRHKIGQPGQEGLMMELLWSDPQAMNGRGPSKRGVGLGFGPDITRKWCELNGVTAILRSHEVRQGGYAEEHDGLCNTVFSAPNYCDSQGNKGAFARIDDQGTIHWTTFEAQPHPPMRPMAYQSGAMGMGGMM